MRKWRWDLKWTSSGGYYLRLRIKNVPGMLGTQGVGDQSSNYVEGSQKESPSFWTAKSGRVIVSLGEQPKVQRAFIICRQWKKSPETLHTPAVTREYTPGSCRNLRKPMRLSPPCEMRPDSPALCPEQLRFPNQTRKEPRFAGLNSIESPTTL